LKIILSLFLWVAGCNALFAQKDSSDNYVKRIESVPAFSVYAVPDSSAYTNLNLRKGSAFILMFFSPECEHCQKETKEMLAYKDELKGVQILMVSALPYAEIKEFYRTFGLAAMPGIKLAQDVNIKLGLLYKVRTFPSMFVYDRRGTLAKAFVGNIAIPAVLDALK
jgi:thiol-disulfide isomerase/thioredoxin